ncbi:cellulose biosynthesis cyclic di-GMP-binding regulatory protein BcsB [Rhodoblastus sp.]|uniref:cellulose biosynthesis cyclic di-GMP-binding regulatory protein BcsB n=1 Tax=Rhodoblastus sp. TaxID=1962975 RepID=UPI003F94802E
MRARLAQAALRSAITFLRAAAGPALAAFLALHPACAQTLADPADGAALLAHSRIALTPPPRWRLKKFASWPDFAPTGSIGAKAGASDKDLPDLVLRHLPNNIQGFRLNGEVGASEWPIYLSETQTHRHLSFRVGYLSAVSVMPEASTLTVFINDVAIGTTKIRAPNKVQTADFDVPAELVKPGFNAVRIAVDQRHRVDCSLAATYELWTQIDPSRTGVLMPSGDAGAKDIEDLAALAPNPQGGLPVRAILPGRTSAANIERMIRVVQFIASVGHFEQPMVDVGPMASGDYGVNLVVGLYADVAKIADLDGLGPVEGPRMALLPQTPTRRATIVITGESEDDVNRALLSFGEASPLRGSEAGLRAAGAFPGYRVSGGQTVRLSELGLRSQEFSGRYFRAGFNIIMPADFYSADYAKVPLDLAGGYAPGLLSSAQIIVSINGRNAVSASLPRSQGEVFKEKTLPLPLGYFRPGLNRIEIEAQLPAAEDSACDPLASIANRKRFLFLDSTQIRIPHLARIGRMPDLAVTATGGFPFIGGAKQPKLYIPSPDRDSIAAAATLAGRMAASAGRPIDFRLTLTAPPVGSGATLVVTGAGALDDSLAATLGVDPVLLRTAWSDRSTQLAAKDGENLSAYDIRARNRLALQKNLPAACHLKRRPSRFASVSAPLAGSFEPPVEAAPPREAAGERDLFVEWSEAQANQGRFRQWFAAAPNGIGDGLRAAFERTVDGARRLAARDGGAPASPVYRSENSLLIAQAVLGTDTDDVWTLVTAPNSTLLSESINCLSDPRIWRQVEGRIAVLDDSDGKISSLPVEQLHFVVTQPLSVSNMRLIAAGWMSINSGVYVALTLAAAILLAFATFHFVRNVGRRDG